MKTKNPYIAIVVIFILAISVYSCRKEFLAGGELDSKLAWAKDYFKESLLPNEGNTIDPHQYVRNLQQVNLMSQKKENHKIPIWQKAMEGKTGDYDFVEVPLKYTTKVTPMIYRHDPNGSTEKIADESILKASLDRLVIFKKKNGKIGQRIISFIPTKAYLDRHNGDISHNRVNKLDKDFEGVLIYRKWNGIFESALVVKNGKGVKRLLLGELLKPKVKKIIFRDQDCGTFDVYEWFVDCTYDGDDPNPKQCSEPYPVWVGTIEIPCDEDPGYDPCLEPENFELCNPGEGGGGGGEEEEVTMDWGSPTDLDLEVTITPEEDGEDAAKYERRRYAWTFHKALNEGFWLRSYEKGRVKKAGTDPWKFLTFEHLTQDPVGAAVGREIEIVLIDKEVDVSASSADIELWYKIHRIGTGFSTTIPLYSSDFYKSKTFAPNDNE